MKILSDTWIHRLALCIYLCILSSQGYTQEAKLFSRMSSEETGISFNNHIVDTKEHNILLYSNYYGGAGVAIGDLDNDGLQDLYFAGNLVADKLYRNTGNLRFEDVSAVAGIVDDGAWSSTVIFGDINNDGLLDIYVTCELYDESPSLRRNKLYINQGSFKFTESAAAYGLDNSERGRGATFIDYDKDGWLDLFLLNQPPNPGNYSPFSGQDLLKYEWGPRLYRNLGNGTFKDVSLQAGVARPAYPNSVIAADLDHDGWQDLYICNDYEAPDFFYRNNGDGTFTNVIDEALKHISYYSMGVDAADINNDGLTDLMTLDMVAEDNFRLKRNMSGMEPELFWKLVKQGGHYQYMFNALHFNQGNGAFSDIAQLAGVSSTDWSWSNLIADFDNDGWKDIYVTNGLLRDIRNSDMAKKFPAFVEKTIRQFIAENPNAGEVDIFDILDLQKGLDMHPSVPLKNYAYQNLGDLEFKNSTMDWGLDIESFSNGCAYGDLDNDGDLEIVVNNINNEAFIFRNNSDQFEHGNYIRLKLEDPEIGHIQGARIAISIEGEKQFLEAANARGMYSSSENIFHFGLGKYELVDEVIIQWTDGKKTILKNVEANQLLEIKKNNVRVSTRKEKEKLDFEAIDARGLGLDFTHQENNFDDYKIQVLLPHEMSHQGPAAAIGDVNGDSLEDIFIGGAKDQSSILYLQTKEGKFKTSPMEWQDDAIYEDVDAAFFDGDGDGDLDLYVVSGGNAYAPRSKFYLDRYYENDGNGNFTRNGHRIPRILESGACVLPFDMDNDGDLDLFLGARHQPWDYPSPTISRILENEDGFFTDVTKTKAEALINIGMVTEAAACDYNQDGLIDLVLVGEWMPICFLKNQGDTFVLDEPAIRRDKTNINTTGWWNTIHAIDLNEDGSEDFILGNLGKNYKYKATQEEPFSVHYYDFDESGQKDIVLSYYNFGEQYPLRGRSCSAEQIPELKASFPSYDLFASSKLDEVYQVDELQQALHYDAHMFESIALIAMPDGSYQVEYLPNAAQLSSVNSILPIQSEHQPSFILSGNMYQSEIETPRNDASVGIIVYRENDVWRTTGAKESGLLLNTDVRSVHAIRIAEEDYLLVISNNEAIQLIRSDKKIR